MYADDYKIKSPYNTYLNKGLPRSDFQWLDAIQSALNPRESPYLFYLSGKDGKPILPNIQRAFGKHGKIFKFQYNKVKMESGNKFMYFVYLIQCEGGSIYTALRRMCKGFKEHQDKVGGHYTRAHKVEKILYTEECQTRSDALKREAEIKKFTRDKKLKMVVRSTQRHIT